MKDYLLCLLFFWLVFPIFVLLYRILIIRTTIYSISQGRLINSHGILSKTFDELELYRVKDYRVTQSFIQRLFKVGTIELITSDKTHPTFSLGLIKDPTETKDMIRNIVENLRTEKKVREFD
ncbi:MAG: PH domain-containing protein [Desulfobacteraceae bacterium]|jgi:uncharacterized membrane protein YdbT with pleckstrin-like domain